MTEQDVGEVNGMIHIMTALLVFGLEKPYKDNADSEDGISLVAVKNAAFRNLSVFRLTEADRQFLIVEDFNKTVITLPKHGRVCLFAASMKFFTLYCFDIYPV